MRAFFTFFYIMKKIYHRYFLLFIVLLGHLSTFAQQTDYKNPSLSVDKRVADLLKRMTLEEKVAQLQTFHGGRPKLYKGLLNNPQKLDSIYGNGVGMLNPDFGSTMEETIEVRNALQHYLRTKT